MQTVAAYLLCVLGGNASPSTSDVEKVITSIGGEADSDKIALLCKELEGKDIAEVIEAGQEKLSTVSIGGGGGAAPAAGAAGAAPEAAKKEEEEEEDADLGGGMDMFGGGDDY